MEISPLALVGIGLATMFFGYFFGLFEGRAQGYRRRKKEEPLDLERRQPSTKSEAPTATHETAPAAAAHATSMLDFGRDDSGQPQMSLDGQRVDPRALTPAEHNRLVELMVMLRPWVEAGSRPKEVPAPAFDMPGDISPSAASFAAGARQERVPAFQAGRSVAPPAAPSSPAAGAPTAPMSLVSQINAILQARIEGTALAARGVRLAESLNGGAIVFVGQDQYAGVADVPDEEVRSAIHSAIAEWEKRYTPS